MATKFLYVQCSNSDDSSKTYKIPDPLSNLSLSQVTSAFKVAFDLGFFNVGSDSPRSIKDAYYQEIIRTSLS